MECIWPKICSMTNNQELSSNCQLQRVRELDLSPCWPERKKGNKINFDILKEILSKKV